VCCQLAHICGCIPARIRHALADLPETLDETYERTLREINKADWEFAHRIFQFVAVAVRPLGVEELAELLAFDFETGTIPKFREDWRLEDPIQAVLSICPSFLAIVDDKIHYSDRKVVQFSHFSVKEFLTSARLAKANNIILHRFHISETLAHILAAQACLGYLLHLNKDVTRASLRNLYFAEYSAEYWVDHVRVEDVSRNVEDGLKELFDRTKSHLEVCIWMYDPCLPSPGPGYRFERPSPPRGTPLHYAALWDLYSIVELLINEHSQNVNSQDFTGSATPLHLASCDGHIKIARRLLECGANVKAQNKDKETPLHVASKRGQTEVARVLIERGADISAQDKDGQTPMHLASQAGKQEVTRVLIECGADVSTQDKDGRTPMHLASQAGDLEVIRVLIEGGADVSAQDKDGRTPMHLATRLASQAWDLESQTRNLESQTRNLELQTRDLETQESQPRARPVSQSLANVESEAAHVESLAGHVESLAGHKFQSRLASRQGLSQAKQQVSQARQQVSQTRQAQARHLSPSREMSRLSQARQQETRQQEARHWVSQAGQVAVIHMLIECGADVSARDKKSQTPLHLASQEGQARIALMLIERGASVLARNKDGQTPLHMVSLGNWNPFTRTSSHPEVARMLIGRGADVSAQDNDSQTPLHLASRTGQSGVVRMLSSLVGGSVSAQN
jgi:ankyrin repeat protein